MTDAKQGPQSGAIDMPPVANAVPVMATTAPMYIEVVKNPRAAPSTYYRESPRTRLFCCVACGVCFVVAVILAGTLGWFYMAHCMSLQAQGPTQVLTKAGVGESSEVTFSDLEKIRLTIRGTSHAAKGSWTFRSETYVHPDYADDIKNASLSGASSDLNFHGNLENMPASWTASTCSYRKTDVAANSAVAKLTVFGLSQAYEIKDLTVLDKADLSLGSGSLDISGLTTASCDVDVGSGSAKLEDSHVAALKMSVGSGETTVHDVTLTKLQHGSEPDCEVLIDVASGKGRIDITKGDGRGDCNLHFSVHSGNMDITLKGFAGSYWTSVRSGSISVDGDDSSGVTFGGGAGDDSVHVQVRSGHAHVRFAR